MTETDRLGMGVMLNLLGGYQGQNAEAWEEMKGHKIVDMDFDEDRLMFTMDDGKKFRLWDNGQSCCEQRYMHTDDDLNAFIGSTIMDIELAEGPTTYDYGEPHEVEFVNVKTSLGVFTLETHNEHNGYYGGFAVCLRREAS